jgi:hypothetical protein
VKLSWTTLVVLAGALQWIVFAARTSFSRERFPKKGMRQTDRALLGSSIVLVVASLVLVDVAALWRGDDGSVQASVTETSQRGSCARVDTGMTASEVQAKMGRPDQTITDEETRGPGASILIYKGSRCAVHLFEGRVEFVE